MGAPGNTIIAVDGHKGRPYGLNFLPDLKSQATTSTAKVAESASHGDFLLATRLAAEGANAVATIPQRVHTMHGPKEGRRTSSGQRVPGNKPMAQLARSGCSIPFLLCGSYPLP